MSKLLRVGPAALDIELRKGSTLNVTMIWKDAAGDPIDLSGHDGRMKIKRFLTDAVAEHDMTVGNGGIFLNETLGSIRLYISDVDSAAFEFDEGVQDLELIDGAGDVVPIFAGKFISPAEVTD